MSDRVPAMGGVRTVPAPDPVARDYLLLALRLDQHRTGLVDAYFGPADLKASADMDALRSPARLAEDAVALRHRLPNEVEDPERRAWLDAQLVALEAQARASAGEVIPYETLVARCFDHAMPRIEDRVFEVAAAELDASLPGMGPLDVRLAELDQRMTIDPARVQVVADHLVAVFRRRAADRFGLPPGESVRISTSRDRSWSAYNWCEGGRHSRVEINLDLPVTVPNLMHTVAHETYPGHHLEMAMKEADLVDVEGRTELTIMLNNTPECLLHEGVADLGFQFAVPAGQESELLREAIDVADLAVAADASALDAVIELARAVRGPRAVLRGISGNAALLRHADGRSHEEVAQYLVSVGRRRPDQAEKQLEFIEDPTWRTYVFVYREGARLLGRWLDLAPAADRPARFARLLAEARAPSAIEAELGDQPPLPTTTS